MKSAPTILAILALAGVTATSGQAQAPSPMSQSSMSGTKMSRADMNTMMSCKRMSNTAMMKNKRCSDMIKMHPAMMKMSSQDMKKMSACMKMSSKAMMADKRCASMMEMHHKKTMSQ